MLKRIYKICSKEEWDEAKKLNFFYGSAIDKRDGYLHFSSSKQVCKTAQLHFKGQESLILLEIRTDKLKIKWEKSRNDDFFPHLYSSLPLTEVTRVFTLNLDEYNNHIFPNWLNDD